MTQRRARARGVSLPVKSAPLNVAGRMGESTARLHLDEGGSFSRFLFNFVLRTLHGTQRGDDVSVHTNELTHGFTEFVTTGVTIAARKSSEAPPQGTIGAEMFVHIHLPADDKHPEPLDITQFLDEVAVEEICLRLRQLEQLLSTYR